MANTETIVIQSLASLTPGSTFVTEQNCTNFQLSFTETGGSFSISLLQDSVTPLPAENTVLSLPFGRVGIVKNVGRGNTLGGLIDKISGPIVPLAATKQNFYGIEPGAAQFLSFLSGFLANPAQLNWSTLDIPIKNFSFRGIALSGIQQLAVYMLADVVVRKNSIYVIDPGSMLDGTSVIPNGSTAASAFKIVKADIVSSDQSIDYGQDVAAVLNPALTAVQINDQGDFVYDSEHAQKQPKTIVQAGTADAGFTPIPDGWLVDGSFEEWTPVPGSGTVDNPSPSVGRYWKQFPSPSNPNNMRGITGFTRIVKDLKLPGNISTFVGSPVTGVTGGGSNNLPNAFQFLGGSTENGIFGFTADDTIISDIVSGQFLELSTALVLTPPGGSSGDASLNFYSIQLEFWTFPRVNPQIIPVGDPVNPFGIPRNVVVVNPSSNVPNLGNAISGYWNKYLANFKLINSPRLKTSISSVFRNVLPQVGDQLIVPVGMKFSSDCGRIRTVTINFGRSGMLLNLTAEKWQFGNGLWNGALI